MNYDTIFEFYLIMPIDFRKYNNVFNNELPTYYQDKYLIFTSFSNRFNHKTEKRNVTNKYEIIRI